MTDAKSRYDRCAHWFWQTVASAHLWTPKIYESYTTPITVIRIIPAGPIDKAFKLARMGLKQDKTGKTAKLTERYLHFDFVVTTRLRELGWSFTDHLTPSHTSKPAEVRAKDDFGYPIATDRVAFCVWPCTQRIIWPEKCTMQRQEEAENMVRTPRFTPLKGELNVVADSWSR